MQHVHTSGPPGGKDEAEGQGTKAPKIKKTKVVPPQVVAAKAAAAKYKLIASEAIDRATDVFGRRVAPPPPPFLPHSSEYRALLCFCNISVCVQAAKKEKQATGATKKLERELAEIRGDLGPEKAKFRIRFQ